jgi:type VI secretion system protein ImpA
MLVNDELIAKLIEPCKPDNSCGLAMDYAPEFVALEQLLYVKPEQQYGDLVIPEETVDWRAVRLASEDLLLQTKDLRVSGYWSQAMVALHGLDGLSAGLTLTFQLLKTYWGDLHPKLEIDGEYDPLLRSNALLGFSAPFGILMSLRKSELLTVKGQIVLIGDAEAAFSTGSLGIASKPKFDRNQLNTMVSEAQLQQQSTLISARAAYQAAKLINELCKEQFGSEFAPDLNPLLALLNCINFPSAEDKEALMSDGIDGGKDSNVEPNLLYNSRKNQSLVTSREDASNAIGQICEYFEISEPASPIPLLLRRAQGMIGKSFIEIMKDLSPESLPRIEIISGVSLVDQ